jgi:hypothetical protein
MASCFVNMKSQGAKECRNVSGAIFVNGGALEDLGVVADSSLWSLRL